MKLSDFANLTEAQAYSETTYRNISSNEAEQFFRLSGQFDPIDAATGNTTAVTLISGLPSTVGDIAKAILSTMAKSSGTWTCDPAKTAGQLNRGAAAVLVANSVIPQNVVDLFFAIGKTVNAPFADATQQAWDEGQALLNPATVEVSYPSADFILNKYRNKVIVTVNIAVASPFADTISFTVASGNTEVVNELPQTSYATDTRPRASIAIPANFTGSLSTEINMSALLTKVKAYATSKLNRDFTATIANAVG